MQVRGFENLTILYIQHASEIIDIYPDLGLFPLTDMQTPPPLKSVPSQKVIMNGAECSESNGKNNKKILRFLFFELSSKIGVIFSLK